MQAHIYSTKSNDNKRFDNSQQKYDWEVTEVFGLVSSWERDNKWDLYFITVVSPIHVNIFYVNLSSSNSFSEFLNFNLYRFVKEELILSQFLYPQGSDFNKNSVFVM